MPGNLYNNSRELARSGLHPLNDFSSSGPLSPPSEGGSPTQPFATWAKPSRQHFNLSLNMSSSPYTRQSLAVGHHSPLELDTDPYLSAQSDPEESDFHASAIRLTPVNGSPNHNSPPRDEARRPSVQSQVYLAPGGNDYPDPSASTSSTDETHFLAPADVMVNYDSLQNAGTLSFGAGAGQPNAAATSHAQWLSSIPLDTAQFLDPEHTMPSPSSVPETATAQGAPLTHGSFAAPQLSGLSSKPAHGPSRLTVSTTQIAQNELSSSSPRGRSPIITISRTSRGDSPNEHAHEQQPSRSLLSPIGPEEMANGYDEEDDDEHHSVSSLSVVPSHNGTWVRTPTAARRGLDPFARGNEYVPSPNELQGQREQGQKNVEISRWTKTVSAANSEAGDSPPALSRGRNQAPKRIRALSTGDRPLQQVDYFNLNASDRSVLGPGLMLHESSDDGIVSEDDSDGSTAPDSLPALADDRRLYDYSTPGEYTSQEVASPGESFPLYPWQDAPRDPVRRAEMRQPGSSAAAMSAYEKRAKEQDAASITATIDNNSIINFSATFERSLRIDAPKKHASWSSSFFKRGVQQAQQRIKRQASDLSLSSVPSNAQQVGGPEVPPPQPQRKESTGSSYRHRLSLSSNKHVPRPHIRSPSLTNALMSMTGQMAAVGGSHSVQVVSPHAEASPKAFPAKWGRDRARSEVPRPTTPGLVDLMTTHGGPPVASLSRYTKAEPDEDEPRTSIAPSLEVHVAEDEDDVEMAGDEKGLVMEFPAISRLPVPTVEGFKSQIMELNPRLNPALVNRFAGEQVRRYRKLIEYQQKHAAAVAKGSCKSGKFCFALGGQAVLLPQRKTAADMESGQTQFRVTDSRDPSYTHGEGAVAAAQFPPGFECPVCFQVKTIQKPSDWSKHIFEDVQPFTCTFPGCPDPKSFKRKADWVRHESERHRQLEWWHCSLADCSHKCYRKNNFLQHLVREHKLPEPKSTPSKEVDRLVEDCKHLTTDTPAEEPCRFCGNNCGTWKKLTVHLGKHMEQLAMPVLALARQSCAFPAQGQPVGIEGSGSAAESQHPHQHQHPHPSTSSVSSSSAASLAAGPFHGQQNAPATGPAPSQAQPQTYLDLPSFNFTTMTDGALSMEPDSMLESQPPGDPQFPGYALGSIGPFDPHAQAQAQATATLHPQGHAHPPHPLHQGSVSYPPLYTRSPDPAAANAHSFSVTSHLPPQAQEPVPTQCQAPGSLYPTPQPGYSAYQPVAPNRSYPSGLYPSSYSSQMG
ncbi:uncharacterized protein N7482_005351 [Penicillium canariense]|uniref:C2H2-type domain-containing protein n=1 Tax=Penicillium canariense TaxID=189055 RepID=A0A9W9LN47_9EURO|nr:uncharacterized protein N7482_005351 [Penicillium canariense]KAJ5166570.1 hypothetical protein N7482_005351 [Penicillium canariense]